MTETETSPDWRDDPGWRPVEYDPSLRDAADVPQRPTAEAELAQPPVWASLYEGHRIAVIWWRPSAPPQPPRATVVVEDDA